MKCGVETRHLRKFRKFPGDKLNPLNGRWHVIGVEWRELLHFRQEFRSDPFWGLVPRPSLDEPMTRSGQLSEKTVVAHPRYHYFQRSNRVPTIDRGIQQGSPTRI